MPEVYSTRTGKKVAIHPDLMKDKRYMNSKGLVPITEVKPELVSNMKEIIDYSKDEPEVKFSDTSLQDKAERDAKFLADNPTAKPVQPTKPKSK